MNLRTSPLSSLLSVSQIIKVILACAYTVICTIVILPRIDQQSWYPKLFNSYNLPPGLDFSSYENAITDINPLNLSTIQKNALLKVLWERITKSRVVDADIYIDSDLLTLHLPEDTSYQLISLLCSQGSLELLYPNDPDTFTENPLLAYDKANYTNSGLDISDVRSAEFKSESEDFSYIDLSINTSARDDWNTFAAEHGTSSIGLSLDGQIYPAWMIASSNTPNPTLVVVFTPDEARVIAELLVQTPLPFALTITDINTVSQNSRETLLQMYILLAGSFAIGLLLRRVLLKESLVSTITTALTISGSIALVKMTSIPFTSELFLGLVLFSSCILGLPARIQPRAYVLAAIAGFFLTFTSQIAMVQVGHMLIISGIFGTALSLFYAFFKINEEV